MTCTIAKPDRLEKMRVLVLKYFQNMTDKPVALTTTLGPGGLGHLPSKRKLYYADLRDELVKSGCGCTMKDLRPSSFGDTKTYATVEDIADMLAKDLT